MRSFPVARRRVRLAAQSAISGKPRAHLSRGPVFCLLTELRPVSDRSETEQPSGSEAKTHDSTQQSRWKLTSGSRQWSQNSFRRRLRKLRRRRSREGRDPTATSLRRRRTCFNPHAREGSRRKYITLVIHEDAFQSTRPRRARLPPEVAATVNAELFQSTRPYGARHRPS